MIPNHSNWITVYEINLSWKKHWLSPIFNFLEKYAFRLSEQTNNFPSNLYYFLTEEQEKLSFFMEHLLYISGKIHVEMQFLSDVSL